MSSFLLPEAPSTASPPTWWRGRGVPVLFAAMALSLVAAMLWVNVLDVRMASVRVFYGAISGWLIVSFVVRSFRIWQFEKSSAAQSPLPWGWRTLMRAMDLMLFVVLWLLALESAARALPPASNSSVNYPGHMFVWPERRARRNSLRLNDREPGEKGNGPRILVLGDSYVEGAGVRRNERFCSQLQGLLRQSHSGGQVIAGGLAGWNTGNEADFLEQYGRKLAPDLVIVAYVLNDAEGEEPLVKPPTNWELWLQTRLHSYLCYRLFRWRRPGFDQYWAQVRRQHEAGSESWLQVEAALRRIAKWCEGEKIPYQLAVLPIFTRDADAVRDVMDQVAERATALGFKAYSTLDDFEGRWQDFAVSSHDAHPNAAAHLRIAVRIAREEGE